MRLLIIEDERALTGLLRDALEQGGFAVDLACTIAEAEDHLNLVTYDAIVLDLGLPDGDGMSLLRVIRSRRGMPAVLVLTARDGFDDRVAGLDAGADDYLVKPFHMPELIARLRALLRRPGAPLGAALAFGNVTLDCASRQVRIQGRNVELTVRETAMLELLLRRQGNVVTREVLEQKLYSFDSQPGSNALEVLVHRLRRRLLEQAADLRVHTVRGVGYLLIEAE